MAITGSDANINSAMDARDSFASTVVDADALTSGGATLNTSNTGYTSSAAQTTGAALAGVTPELADAFGRAVEAYAQEVKTHIDDLSKPEMNAAFKGTQIQAALNTFIDGVKQTADSYLRALAQVETNIVSEVKAAYATQDEDLSGQLGSDTESVIGSSAQIQ